MLEALLIVVVGLTPSLFSIWLMRQADVRTQARLRLALNSVTSRGLPRFHLSPDHHYIDGVGYMIGDITCRFNARSSHIRCAVNPMGPCDGCSAYESRTWDDGSATAEE
ncbi:MAG: DUF6464 family protein [Leptolyngbyaceae cyanobacterium bins.302]|nr:DUF6464 family protein [Leptolyngbyaceae cyanobacterium bins.302]